MKDAGDALSRHPIAVPVATALAVLSAFSVTKGFTNGFALVGALTPVTLLYIGFLCWARGGRAPKVVIVALILFTLFLLVMVLVTLA
jgi:hypothetical protein